MCDLKHLKCKYTDCSVRPSYNYEGLKNGLFCVSHKELSMVNVISKKCSYENCTKQPAYNYEGTNIGMYCTEHKLPMMIDIKNKLCSVQNFHYIILKMKKMENIVYYIKIQK
jgi:hypothetical protein